MTDRRYSYSLTIEGKVFNISPIVDSSSLSVMSALCSTKKKSAKNNMSVSLKGGANPSFYATFMQALLESQANNTIKDCLFIVTDTTSNTVMFSGYLDSSEIEINSKHFPDSLELSAMDKTMLLDNKIRVNQHWENTSRNQIVKDLIDAMEEDTGKTISLLSTELSDTDKIGNYSVTEDMNKTYRDIIDLILFEAVGYVIVYDPQNDGYRIKRIPTALDENTTYRQIKYMVGNGLKTKSVLYKNDGILLSYPTIVTRQNTNLYFENISLKTDGNGKLKGDTVYSGQYYPKDGDVKAIHQNYRIADRPYVSGESRLQNEDLKLLYAKDVSYELASNPQLSLAPALPNIDWDGIPKFYPNKAWVLFRNDNSAIYIASEDTSVDDSKTYYTKSGNVYTPIENPSSDANPKQNGWYEEQGSNVTTFSLTGTAIYVDYMNKLTVPNLCQNPEEYEVQTITDAQKAKDFAQWYYNSQRYGGTTSQWNEPEGYSTLGEIVYVVHKETGIQMPHVIVQMTDECAGGASGTIRMKKVVAISLYGWQEYTASTVTANRNGSNTSSEQTPSRWTNGTSLWGETTARGWEGNVGDYYLNTENYNLYRCTTSGTSSTALWTYIGNLKGKDADISNIQQEIEYGLSESDEEFIFPVSNWGYTGGEYGYDEDSEFGFRDVGGWSDNFDRWYKGLYVWQRVNTVDANGTFTYGTPVYCSDITQALIDSCVFSITPETTTWDKDLRSSDTQDITFTMNVTGYQNPTSGLDLQNFMIYGVKNGTETLLLYPLVQSGLTFTFTIPDNLDYDTLRIHTQGVNGESADAYISANDITSYNHNYGITSVLPTGDFLDGDSLVLEQTVYTFYVYSAYPNGLDANDYPSFSPTYSSGLSYIGIGYSTTNSRPTEATSYTWSKYVSTGTDTSQNGYFPYVYHNDEWMLIDENNFVNFSTQIAQNRDVVLANGINVQPSSVIMYAYFKIISAQKAQIDALTTEEIILKDTGIIRSENYTEDGEGNPTNGIYVDGAGNSKFVKSTIVDAIVSGSFTSEPLETQTATQGNTVNGSWDSTAEYNDKDSYDIIANNLGNGSLASVSGTYGNDTVNKVLMLKTSDKKTQTMTLVSQGSIVQSTQIGGTLPVRCDNVKVSGTALKKVLHSLVTSDTSRTATMKYSMNGSTWLNLGSSVTVRGSVNQNLYVKQTYNDASIDVGTYNNWQTARILPSDTIMANNELFDVVTMAKDGSILTTGKNCTIYRSTDGGSIWSSVHLYSPADDNIASHVMNCGDALLAVVVVSGSERAGMYRSTDNGLTWTQVVSSVLFQWHGAYGNGEFRICAYNQGYGYYSSTDDGLTWTYVADDDYNGEVVFGNGMFLTPRKLSKSLGVGALSTTLSFANGYFIAVERNKANAPLYFSTDGENWTVVNMFSMLSTSDKIIGSCSPICYSRGYYYAVVLQRYRSEGNGIWFSTDLTNWTHLLSFTSYNPNLAFVGGRFLYHYSNSSSNYTDYYLDFVSYTDADWEVETNGSLSITYDYSYYNLGANLISASNPLLKTIYDDVSIWDTKKTTISMWSLSPTPYYKFSSFGVASFDARGYANGSTFTINYQKYGAGVVNITSSTSGGYVYNLKWNGTTFVIYLNGTAVNSFNMTDRFRATHTIQFTPLGQTDAILVKDIIPKNDSVYALGDDGNEFAVAYADNFYGSYNSGSKRSLKENIKDYTRSALEILENTKIVSFNYKKDKDKVTKIGFIADDTDSDIAGKEHDRMDLNSCIGVLIKAIQELSAEIEELKNGGNS